jgi:hypothetical protein
MFITCWLINGNGERPDTQAAAAAAVAAVAAASALLAESSAAICTNARSGAVAVVVLALNMQAFGPLGAKLQTQGNHRRILPSLHLPD